VVVVKPLAQVIGGYLCCNGHDKINQDLNHRVTHLLSVARMEKGSATSFDPIQQKAPGTATTGGFVF